MPAAMADAMGIGAMAVARARRVSSHAARAAAAAAPHPAPRMVGGERRAGREAAAAAAAAEAAAAAAKAAEEEEAADSLFDRGPGFSFWGGRGPDGSQVAISRDLPRSPAFSDLL